jgi:hypothetical protein
MLEELAFAAGVVLMVPSAMLTAQQTTVPPQATPFSINPEAPGSHGSAQLGHLGAGQSLTDRLSQSNGTIQPPDVDPGMQKLPPPSRGNMPVLKPAPNTRSK